MSPAPPSNRSNAGTKGVARAYREAQIVEEACRSFGEGGFIGTSVDDIAKAAGISKALIYNYFGSKEGLFSACLVHAGSLLAADMERTAASGAVGLQRAVVTLEGVFTVLESRPWLWQLFFDPTVPGTPEIDEAIARYTRRITLLAEDGVGELMELSGNDDPLDRAAMVAVWSSVFNSLVTWSISHPEESPEQMTQRCARLFAGLAPGLQPRRPTPHS
ncbi:TetR/AcrR family transcriptional regulator (plasmid) [Rhodococcus pseudokoreensis]|uniref:TetR/AcrR family transcriptional regulator n=1 Tax=Rhodococcus pseudokoreensis TaxID=2811421 RepID=A0A974VYQ3_9NOCA|nr:TetR/AcrR family transcriptional regulator [Rhodococcus pseudokoreensis]QSE88013.1 TetR/AcrR family transcriptional regulator [Rhodococcus pseudokoreensis]